MAIVVRAKGTQKRKLKTMAQRSKDRDVTRRALAVLALLNGRSVSEVADSMVAARSTVYRWVGWFLAEGTRGLCRSAGGRARRTVTDECLDALHTLLGDSPREYGYLRSTWSSELLSRALLWHYGLRIHASTVRRCLKAHGYGWRRARPTLHKRDPQKAQKLGRINHALARASDKTEVFYVDEVDIDLNPRIGFTWSARAHQQAIATPGQNVKHYVAGALNSRTGKLVWVEHHAKNTTLFVKLLEALRRTYRRAHTIVLVLDNYIIHKAEVVHAWLEHNPKFRFVFQPVYHPWVNQIERLWKAMHDTVTRNHRHSSMFELCQDVMRFFEVVQPFPGSGHGVAQFRSAI